MPHAHFEAFLADSVQEDTEIEKSLNLEELYGLYISWCFLKNEKLQAPEALWQALRAHQIEPSDNHLVMKGPAAADYITASAPNLV